MATDIEIRELKNLKAIARKGREATIMLEKFVDELRPMLVKAYEDGEMPYKIQLKMNISFKVLKPGAKK